MSKPSPILGRDLGLAICKHFGIDTTKHTVESDFEIKTEPGKPATVTLTFMLAADDLAGIARMAGAEGWKTVMAGWPSRSSNDIDPGFAAPPHRCGAYETATEFYKGHPDVAAAFSGDAAETLKRYGAGSGRSEIAALTEEVRQLRTEISALLYEVAKNTKRSQPSGSNPIPQPNPVR